MGKMEAVKRRRDKDLGAFCWILAKEEGAFEGFLCFVSKIPVKVRAVGNARRSGSLNQKQEGEVLAPELKHLKVHAKSPERSSYLNSAASEQFRWEKVGGCSTLTGRHTRPCRGECT
ncbi:hypothetical protein VNO77_42241 [Canavalia gladiata]|uniref:Uncharacterized protein n=1 Tax=Canavalia gladiata TaxID=3824 RepID=A0AAN9K0N7_CANGL